jgi:antitoxin component YwqK of YwqJK toxin-antitoxin module
MNKAIIYNETDFEENIYDFFTFMMYKGKPFTGTLIEGKATIEFKDGNAHGRSVEYYGHGQIAVDNVYENGNYKHGKEWYTDGQLKFDSIGKEWYPNGQLKRDSTGKDSFCWDVDGKLAKINDSWLYKNGIKINETDANGDRLTFSSNGDLAIKTTPNKEFGVNHFFDRVLSQYYQELLTNLYPELNSDFSYSVRYICGWIEKVYCQDAKRGNALIQKLTEHKDANTREHANLLNKLAIKKEGGSDERTYWLEDNPNYIIIY